MKLKVIWMGWECDYSEIMMRGDSKSSKSMSKPWVMRCLTLENSRAFCRKVLGININKARLSTEF